MSCRAGHCPTCRCAQGSSLYAACGRGPSPPAPPAPAGLLPSRQAPPKIAACSRTYRKPERGAGSLRGQAVSPGAPRLFQPGLRSRAKNSCTSGQSHSRPMATSTSGAGNSSCFVYLSIFWRRRSVRRTVSRCCPAPATAGQRCRGAARRVGPESRPPACHRASLVVAPARRRSAPPARATACPCSSRLPVPETSGAGSSGPHAAAACRNAGRSRSGQRGCPQPATRD